MFTKIYQSKSYDRSLRSQMTTERLSNLALLSIEKDVTDALVIVM